MSVSTSFFIDNLGCSKNQVDAEVMLAVLERAGWRRSPDAGNADLIIVNSCGFIDSAKQESIAVAFDYQRSFPQTPVVMAGCLSQRYPDEIFGDMPELAGVFGNRDPSRVIEIADAVLAGRRTVLVPAARRPQPPRNGLLSFPGSAYVKISEGCDSRCSFCAIPSIRGALHSRSIDEVVQEVTALLQRGIFEITLVSQDFSAFGRDRGGSEAVRLMQAISDLPGDFWIRPLYVYPEEFPRPILDICAADPRILPYFDLPFQHANRSVLRAMGRPGDGERYLELVGEIRRALPDSVLRATLMVGFPGEGDKEFEELLRFQQRAELDWAGFFTFSPQEGTAAHRLGARLSPVAPRRAQQRMRELESAQRRISERRLRRFVGRKLRLLLEEPVSGEPLYLARAWCHAPDVDGLVVLRTGGLPKARLQPGMVVDARIVRVNGLDLEAVPVAPGASAAAETAAVAAASPDRVAPQARAVLQAPDGPAARGRQP